MQRFDIWNVFFKKVETAASMYVAHLHNLIKPYCYPFKRQFHKMVKLTQTIRRQFADKLF